MIFVKKNKQKILDEPLIVIANHTSYLDIFMMYQILPMRHLVFMGKSEILKYPLIRTYFKYLHIPVDRSDKRKSAQSMLLAKKKLQEGYSIVIFPEGGIPDNQAPKMASFKLGAFVLAQKNQVPLVPITLKNHYLLLSEPQYFKNSARPGISHVYIHPVISAVALNEKAAEFWMQETREHISSKL